MSGCDLITFYSFAGYSAVEGATATVVADQGAIPKCAILVSFLTRLAAVSFDLSSKCNLVILSVPTFRISLVSFISVAFAFWVIFMTSLSIYRSLHQQQGYLSPLFQLSLHGCDLPCGTT